MLCFQRVRTVAICSGGAYCCNFMEEIVGTNARAQTSRLSRLSLIQTQTK